MVVLTYDPFLAADVPARQDLGEGGVEIGGRGTRGIRCALPAAWGGRPGCLAHDRGAAVVQELHVQVGDLLSGIRKLEPAGRLEGADGGRLDALRRAQGL